MCVINNYYNISKRPLKIRLLKINLLLFLKRDINLIFFIFTVRPLSIKLVGENRPLSAEVSANISCRVIGAKPTPIITWWKDDNQMTDAKQIVSNSRIKL